MESRCQRLRGTDHGTSTKLAVLSAWRKASARLALLFLLFPLGACATWWTPEPLPLERPLLWQIRSSDHTSYLFGTMHVGLLTKRNMPPMVRRALETSRHFVMEVNPETNLGDLLPLVMRSDGTTLDQKLSPESWRQLKTLLGPKHPEDTLRKYRAWFAYSALMSEEMTPSNLNGNAMSSQSLPAMDIFLAQQAEDNGLTIGYLETAREQIRMLDQTITDSDLDKVLTRLRANRPSLGKQQLATYRSGDEKAIEAEIRDSEEDEGMSPADIKLLIDERNHRWVRQLLPLLKSQRTFIAVGAAHLVGEQGLVALLKEQGFTVQRVEAPAKL